MSAENGNKNGKKLSGIQKYSLKMREKERDFSLTYPASSKNKKSVSETDIVSSEEQRHVKVARTKKKSPQIKKQHVLTDRERTRKEKRNSRFSTHGRPVIIFIFAFLLLLTTVFSGLLSYTYIVDRIENPFYSDEIQLDPDTTVKFKIEKGWTTKQIVEKLEEMGLIKNARIYSILSKFNGYDSTYKSGVHYLSKGLTYDQIMTILSDDPLTVNVTIPEGFTTAQIAARLEDNNVCGASDFLKAVNSADVSSYSFIPQEKGDRDYKLDGFLFPDTYEFEVDSSPEAVIYKMLNTFNNKFKTEYFERAREQFGLSADQVVNLAAIVEKEALLDKEREIIAMVYYNRLTNPEYQYMESDATVLYAMRRQGIIAREVKPEDRKTDDIYNTYKYPGLTPGPICNPGEKSILAVIRMNRHNYYYYVALNDGSKEHHFSETFAEHKAFIEAQEAE